MEIAYCPACKKWVNSNRIKEDYPPATYNQIDPPDYYEKFPCETKVVVEDVKWLEDQEIIDALNDAEVVP